MQYILFGNPVSHSLSPFIHQHFAAQFELGIEYQAQAVAINDFPAALQAFRAQGGQGANITAPLKSLAYSLCDKTSSTAALAQAVNTLYWDSQHQLYGDNTDGAGLVRDLHYYNYDIKHKSILIIGAGGAAAGIIPALLDQEPSSITIANRTLERALSLKARIPDARVEVLDFEQLNNPTKIFNFDSIINATSASVFNNLIPISPALIQDKVVYDLAYNLEKPTVLVAWAQRNGAKVAYDGVGMLIEQAAQAFYIWHQQWPNTQALRLLLKNYKI